MAESYRIRCVVRPGEKPPCLKHVELLDSKCFLADEREPLEDRYWWLAYPDRSPRPVAYAGLRVEGNEAFLCRAGVIKTHRGQGLHHRLIQARIAMAKKLGLRRLYTYTALWNAASSNSLIGMGFKLYVPQARWAGAEFNYFELEL